MLSKFLFPSTALYTRSLEDEKYAKVLGHSLVFEPYVTETLRQAILQMDRKLKGFANPDAVLTAIETRSSSPVRILRDETFQSNIRGLYPCGEGAGYAGGIVSSAGGGGPPNLYNGGLEQFSSVAKNSRNYMYAGIFYAF